MYCYIKTSTFIYNGRMYLSKNRHYHNSNFIQYHNSNMMTSWNGNISRVTGHLCGKFTGPGEFPAQKPVTRSFDFLFYLRLNKRLSKQSWCWWFETPSRSLCRHRNDLVQHDNWFKQKWPIPSNGMHILNVSFRLNMLTNFLHFITMLTYRNINPDANVLFKGNLLPEPRYRISW